MDGEVIIVRHLHVFSIDTVLTLASRYRKRHLRAYLCSARYSTGSTTCELRCYRRQLCPIELGLTTAAVSNAAPLYHLSFLFCTICSPNHTSFTSRMARMDTD